HEYYDAPAECGHSNYCYRQHHFNPFSRRSRSSRKDAASLVDSDSVFSHVCNVVRSGVFILPSSGCRLRNSANCTSCWAIRAALASKSLLIAEMRACASMRPIVNISVSTTEAMSFSAAVCGTVVTSVAPLPSAKDRVTLIWTANELPSL